MEWCIDCNMPVTRCLCDKDLVTLDEIVKEVGERYGELLETLLRPLTTEQILCVHELPFTQDDQNRYWVGFQYHIMAQGDICDLEVRKEQYQKNS